RLHSMLVEFYLWPGQVAVAWRLGLLRQVSDNGSVRFQAAQDVRANQLAQRRKLVLLTRLQAFHKRLKHCSRPEQGRVEKIEQRPQIAQTVFDRRAGQGNARLG